VNSIVGKRMAKSQQMRWSLQGAHLLMQVRTADINGERRDRMRAEFRKPDPPVPSAFRTQAAAPPRRLTPAMLPVSRSRRSPGRTVQDRNRSPPGGLIDQKFPTPIRQQHPESCEHEIVIL